ncbi:MAG: hypothetical protein J6M14_00135 [Campylobacter sp.]|nr:hypothetical protein [Campylobacter sp.]
MKTSEAVQSQSSKRRSRFYNFEHYQKFAGLLRFVRKKWQISHANLVYIDIFINLLFATFK